MAEKTASLGRPISVIRDELRNDEYTRKIAKMLNMDLDEYIDQVLDFATHPGKEPEFYVFDEAQLQAEGIETEAPSNQEVVQWLKKVENGEISLSPGQLSENSSFSAQEAAAVRQAQALTGKTNKMTAPTEMGSGKFETTDDEAGNELKKQMLGGALKSKR